MYQDVHIAKLKRQLKHSQQFGRRVSARCDHQSLQLAAALQKGRSGEASLDIRRRGASNKLTPAASFALAIRRNLGTCSAKSLGPCLLESVHQTTVCSAEIRCAAALLANARRFSDIYIHIIESKKIYQTSFDLGCSHSNFIHSTGVVRR